MKRRSTSDDKEVKKRQKQRIAEAKAEAKRIEHQRKAEAYKQKNKNDTRIRMRNKRNSSFTQLASNTKNTVRNTLQRIGIMNNMLNSTGVEVQRT